MLWYTSYSALQLFVRSLRLATLDCLPKYGGGAVEEVRGQVEHDGELGELLEELPRGQRRVVRRPAADQEEAATPLKEEESEKST